MRVFITHILPEDKILKYQLSVAACNFSWNLINGCVFNRFYSIMPAYVHSKLDDVIMPELVFSPFRDKGRILRRIAILHENLMIYRRLPKSCSVWLYNISSLNLPLFFLLRWFRKKTQVNVIVLDYTPAKDLLSRLCLWALNHCNSTITLAQSPLFLVKNTVCLPGVTPNHFEDVFRQEHINNSFLLSGVLNERIAMLSMVLAAFSQMPELSLHITGFVKDESLILQFKDCKNIIYHGKVNYEEYLNIFHQCSFQLSTRNPNCLENQCNFPSKIMEALLHNRIIVSTLYYEQLRDIKIFQVSSNCNQFVRDLRAIVSLSEEQLLKYANQSNKVLDYFSAFVWQQAMSQLEHNKTYK